MEIENHVKRGGSEVDKKDFHCRRESGLAYDSTEDGVDNVTVTNGARKESGYWGDMDLDLSTSLAWSRDVTAHNTMLPLRPN